MRVQNFAGFMKFRAAGKINEQGDYMGSSPSEYTGMEGEDPGFPRNEYWEENEMSFGANPEEEENPDLEENPEGEEGGEEQEEVTLEDLKAMLDDLTERVEKLEGGGEEEEGAEGEEAPAEDEEEAPAEGEEEAPAEEAKK